MCVEGGRGGGGGHCFIGSKDGPICVGAARLQPAGRERLPDCLQARKHVCMQACLPASCRTPPRRVAAHLAHLPGQGQQQVPGRVVLPPVSCSGKLLQQTAQVLQGGVAPWMICWHGGRCGGRCRRMMRRGGGGGGSGCDGGSFGRGALGPTRAGILILLMLRLIRRRHADGRALFRASETVFEKTRTATATKLIGGKGAHQRNTTLTSAAPVAGQLLLGGAGHSWRQVGGLLLRGAFSLEPAVVTVK